MLATMIASRILAAQSPTPATPNVSGAWRGALVLKSGSETHSDPFYVVLKQDGDTVTGTAGPDADRQFRIRNGKAASGKDTTTVTFELIVDGVHMTVELKLFEGALKGTATMEGEDGQRETATVELKRTS